MERHVAPKALAIGLISVGLITALISLPAQSQSLKDIFRGVVRDTLGNKAANAAAGTDANAEDDAKKMYWDDFQYTPLILDGHTLYRFGNSAQSKYGYGVGGRPTCDEMILLSTLTKTDLTSDQVASCIQREEFLQQQSAQLNHPLPLNWPKPDRYISQRQSDFGVLPLKLYYRFPFMTTKDVRPNGIYFNFGGAHPLVGGASLAAGPNNVDITLKGPDVKYQWEYTGLRRHSDRGHVQLFINSTPEQKNAIANSNRSQAWDTIFYTIHSVERVAPLLGNRPHYEISLTVDRVELGMEEGHAPPSRKFTF